MIQERTFHRIVCDGCGLVGIDEEYVEGEKLAAEQTLSERSESGGWKVDADSDLCPGCVEKGAIKTHIYDNETLRYREWMGTVDSAPEEDVRRRLKYVLDSLYGVGDGTAESARDYDRDREWDSDTLDSIGQDVHDYVHDYAPPKEKE